MIVLDLFPEIGGESLPGHLTKCLVYEARSSCKRSVFLAYGRVGRAVFYENCRMFGLTSIYTPAFGIAKVNFVSALTFAIFASPRSANIGCVSA